MKNWILFYLSVIVVSLALQFSACHTVTTAATPADLKSVPTSQSVALSVVLDKIKARDPAWVDPAGNVKADAIVPILTADKAAWDQLDTFYNK